MKGGIIFCAVFMFIISCSPKEITKSQMEISKETIYVCLTFNAESNLPDSSLRVNYLKRNNFDFTLQNTTDDELNININYSKFYINSKPADLFYASRDEILNKIYLPGKSTIQLHGTRNVLDSFSKFLNLAYNDKKVTPTKFQRSNSPLLVEAEFNFGKGNVNNYKYGIWLSEIDEINLQQYKKGLAAPENNKVFLSIETESSVEKSPDKRERKGAGNALILAGVFVAVVIAVFTANSITFF